MPLALGRADRKLLLVTAGVIAALIAASVLLEGPEEPEAGIPSSYSAGSTGAKAVYLLLRESGYRVERWQLPAAELPADAAAYTLILADPVIPPSRRDRDALARFVTRGGRVLATGALAAQMLPEGGATRRVWRGKWEKFPALVPAEITRGVPEVTLDARTSWSAKRPSHLPLYGDPAAPVVVQYQVGAGQVIWWAGAAPLTNLGLKSPGSVELLLNSVGPAGRRVLWDEYLHGERDSLWSYVARTPAPWALAQLGVLALALIATYSRRSGPVRAPRSESRQSPLEFVETLGGLYHKSHAGAAAVEIAYQHFRYLLTRRLGLPAQAAAEQLARDIRQRLHYPDPMLEETLLRAERAMADPELSDKEAVPIVRALRRYGRELRLTERT